MNEKNIRFSALLKTAENRIFFSYLSLMEKENFVQFSAACQCVENRVFGGCFISCRTRRIVFNSQRSSKALRIVYLTRIGDSLYFPILAGFYALYEGAEN